MKKVIWKKSSEKLQLSVWFFFKVFFFCWDKIFTGTFMKSCPAVKMISYDRFGGDAVFCCEDDWLRHFLGAEFVSNTDIVMTTNQTLRRFLQY